MIRYIPDVTIACEKTQFRVIYMPQSNANWDEMPVLFTVNDLRKYLGLTRGEAYELAHVVGRKLRRRLLVPRSALQTWWEKQQG